MKYHDQKVTSWREWFTQESEELKMQNPQSPWLWRKDWAKGVIHPSQASAYLFLFLGLVFLAVSSPLFFQLQKELDKGRWIALVALLFPIAGLGMISHFLLHLWRRKKYGDVKLFLKTPTGVIGGTFECELLIPYRFQEIRKLDLNLHCVHSYISGSGKNRTRHEILLWEQKVTAPLNFDGKHNVAHFIFNIPIEQKSTDQTNPNNQILWRAIVDLPQVGPDFKFSFYVPVFKTIDSNHEITEKSLRKKELDSHSESHSNEFFLFEELRNGEWSIKTSPSNTRSLSLSLMVFGLIFLLSGSGIGYVALYKNSGFTRYFMMIFPIVFCSVGGLIGLLGFLEMIRKTEILVKTESLLVTHKYLIFKKQRSIELNDIESTSLTSQNKSSQQIWYDIQLTGNFNKNKNRIILPIRCKDKLKAQWLLKKLEDHISKSSSHYKKTS